MSLHSVIVGVRALFLIPLSIFLLACTATLMVLFNVDERTINGPLAKRWARLVLWLADARVTVHGVENIPFIQQPYIVVMNHQSNMDIPVLVHSLPLQVRFIGKIELMKIPVFGSALLKAGHFLVDRRDHQRAMENIRGAGDVMKSKGVSVVFAPEGTRSPSGRLLDFKKGAFVTGIETGIPVLPVTIQGTRLSLPKGSMWARTASITVHIHPPVPTEGLVYADRDKLLEKVRGIMERGLREQPKAQCPKAKDKSR